MSEELNKPISIEEEKEWMAKRLLSILGEREKIDDPLCLK